MIDVVMPTYGRSDLAFAKGEGCYLFTAGGRRYLDFASGIAVTALGHAHPKLISALTEQAGRYWHVSNLHQIPEQTRLAETLVAHSFADTVFFCNSGAEANEAGLKLIRRYWHNQGETKKRRVITAAGAFHGRTMATIVAGGAAKYTEGFDPLIDGFDQVPFGNLNVLRQSVTDETAAILVEPVQGEGGINPADPEYLQGLRRAADEYGVLLMIDEVQTGIGRTGTLFAHEQAQIAPDILTSAKGLGGGFPIGALLAGEKAGAALTPGTHGSTFGGNPLACAVAQAVLEEILSDGFLDQVRMRADALSHGLDAIRRRYPGFIEQVRGAGLMIGLKMGPPNLDVIDALQARRMLSVPAGDNVVRLLPPLIITQTEIDEALDVLDAVAEDMAA